MSAAEVCMTNNINSLPGDVLRIVVEVQSSTNHEQERGQVQ